MDAEYYFDTYALIEFVEGKENYQRFQDTPIITSFYNIYEFACYLLRDHDREKAERVLDKLNYNLIEPEEDDLIPSAKFKLENRSQQLSYVDCMGYRLAERHDLKFLTGDQEFEDKENVEYVD
ncbi:MAG: PIN domain-containing protein [Candidatus Nanohalobium sp.]